MDEATKAELKRIDQENERQNRRLQNLEQKVDTIGQINVNLQKMADNMERMFDEQARQGKVMDKQDKRLEELERVPADSWRKTSSTIYNTVLVAACSGVCAVVGALIMYAMRSLM